MNNEYKEKNVSTNGTNQGPTSFYIVDFIKNLTEEKNIPVLIYLILNIFVIGLVLNVLFSETPFIVTFLVGLVLYGISIVLALSPLGEALLRFQNGCTKLARKDDIDRLEPIFKEVYSQAKKLNKNMPNDIKLYINDEESENAFATGRKTICVTRGLLNLSDEHIKATLAHEFGHLAHKDTDLILVVSVGNLIITFIVTIIKLLILLFQLLGTLMGMFLGGSDGLIATIVTSITSLLTALFVTGAMWVWTQIGILLTMKSSRAHEDKADEFAYNLGYGKALCEVLDSISGPEPKGLFANLKSSHPKTSLRIAHLQSLGVKYPD